MVTNDTSNLKVDTGYSGGTDITWTHTCVADSTLLVVCVSLWQDVAGTGTITSMTYNSVAMTKAVGYTGTGTTMRSEIWYLASPDTGSAYTISATVTGATDQRDFTSSSWLGTETDDPLDTTSSGSIGSVTPITSSLSAGYTYTLLIDCATRYSTAAVTKGTDQTLLKSDVSGSITTASSYQIGTEDEAYTFSWTTTEDNDWSHIIASFKSPDSTANLASTFNWKGYLWDRRPATITGGPTYNGKYAMNNVSGPDSDHYITLKITNPTGSSPIAAEFYSDQQGWGYGTYICVVATRLDTLYKNAVFGGLFLYDSAVTVTANEIDICEASAWGASTAVLLSHVYWTDVDGTDTSVSESIDVTSDVIQTHVMKWKSDSLTFDTYQGTGTGGKCIFHSYWTDEIPTPNLERVCFNAWVFGSSGTPAATPLTEIIIRDFTFNAEGVWSEINKNPTGWTKTSDVTTGWTKGTNYSTSWTPGSNVGTAWTKV